MFVPLSALWCKELRRRQVVYGVWWCMVYAEEVVYVMVVQECWHRKGIDVHERA